MAHGAFLLMGLLVAIPAGEIALGMISQAVGRTTMATNPDGTQRTVYWRDYPGIAGVDPQKTSTAPPRRRGTLPGREWWESSGQHSARSFSSSGQPGSKGRVTLTCFRKEPRIGLAGNRCWRS